jgi:hypothetical protein
VCAGHLLYAARALDAADRDVAKAEAAFAAELLDGLIALPLDSCNRERLEWLAEEITDAVGEPTIWVGELGAAVQECEPPARMREAVAAEYRAVIEEVGNTKRSARRRSRRSF